MSIVAMGNVAAAVFNRLGARRGPAAAAGEALQGLAVVGFAALSLARIAALLTGYGAPMALYNSLPQAILFVPPPLPPPPEAPRACACARACVYTPMVLNAPTYQGMFLSALSSSSCSGTV